MNGRWSRLRAAAALGGPQRRVSIITPNRFLSGPSARQPLHPDESRSIENGTSDSVVQISATVVQRGSRSDFLEWGPSIAAKEALQRANDSRQDSVPDGPPPELSHDERRLLAKARLYGILPSKEALLNEADVGHTTKIGSKLLDQPKHRHDLDFWRFILEVRQHYDGLTGLKATWRGMMWRGQPVELSPDNSLAVQLMQTFIAAGASHDIRFLQQLCKDCAWRKVFQSRLFVEVAGALLESNPQHILIAKSCGTRLSTPADLLEIFEKACGSEADGAIRAFCVLQSRLPDFKVYHDTVTRLWERGRSADAIAMHKHLIARKDFPQNFEVLIPYVRQLAEANENPNTLVTQLNAAGISYEAQIRRLYAHERAQVVGFSPETLNVVSGNMFGRKQGKLSDHTIARALATGSFSFNFVIETMHMFGIIEFGPLSIRQMALTSASSEILRQRFIKLQDYQIDLGSSAYGRIMKHLALSGKSDLVRDLAKTDMHHEEFEDVHLQRRLLEYFASKGDLSQLNRTLAILADGKSNGSKEQEYLLNCLLRAAVKAHDWVSVLQHIDAFRQKRLCVNETVLQFTINSLVPRRHTLFENSNFSFDSVGFLVGALQQIMVSGSRVRPIHWFRPVVALGDQGRLDELGHLLKWLAAQYVRQDDLESSDQSVAKDYFTDWNALFTTGLQSMLVSWSFKELDWKALWLSDDLHDQRPATPWLHGSRVLKSLRDDYHVEIDESVARGTFLRRLRWMYGSQLPGRASANRDAAAARGFNPSSILRTEADLWGSKAAEDHSRDFDARVDPKEKAKSIRLAPDEEVSATSSTNGRNVSGFTEGERLHDHG